MGEHSASGNVRDDCGGQAGVAQAGARLRFGMGSVRMLSELVCPGACQ